MKVHIQLKSPKNKKNILCMSLFSRPLQLYPPYICLCSLEHHAVIQQNLGDITMHELNILWNISFEITSYKENSTELIHTKKDTAR